MSFNWLRFRFNIIADILHQIVANQLTQIRILNRIETNTSNIALQLAQLIKIWTPPVPVRFEIVLTHNPKSDGPSPMVESGSSSSPSSSSDSSSPNFNLQQGDSPNMSNSKSLKAGVDFQLNDDGTATATLQPIDSKEEVTVLPTGALVPVWASSDPGVTVNAAPDGLTAAVAPNITPGQTLPVGVIISVSCDLGDGNTISGTSDPIDVIPGKAAGFQISLQ